MKMKSIIFCVSCSLLTATSFAGENFSTLNGIPAEVMSNTEMNNVEGKMFQGYYGGILGNLYFQSPRTFLPAYQIGIRNAFSLNNYLDNLRVNGGSSYSYLFGLTQLVQFAKSPLF